MPTSFKGKKRFTITRAVIIPWYDYRSKIGLYIGYGLGIIYVFFRIHTFDFSEMNFLSVLDILTIILIYLVSGPLIRLLIAAINSSRESYLEVWVIHNEAGRLCKVIDITKRTNHDPMKVLNRWLNSNTYTQIEIQMLYYEEKYEDAFIAIK